MTRPTTALALLLLVAAAAASAERRLLQSESAVAIATPGFTGTAATPGGSASARFQAAVPPGGLLPSSSPWEFGACPLVVEGADFFGNDFANGTQADVGACCASCTASLEAWLRANPGGIPSATDAACVAWTYLPSKQCFLKNRVQTDNKLTVVPSPTAYTGSVIGLLGSDAAAAYDDLVATYFEPISVRSVSVAIVGGVPAAEAASSCGEPRCQQIAARLNETALATQEAAATTG